MTAGEIEIRFRVDVVRLGRDMDAVRRTVADAGQDAGQSLESMRDSALAALKQVAALTDQYAKLTGQLRLATDSNTQYAQAYADVRRIAKDTQADLSATGALYAGLAHHTRELGLSQQEVAALTETVNLAMQVSGTTAEGSAAAIQQLSQAFAFGKLSGEEFSAVYSSAPRLMEALADGMGVPLATLKTMAEQGEVTSQVMAQVLPESLAKLRAEGQQVQTIGGAFNNLKSDVIDFVGAAADATGAVALASGALNLLGSNLPLVTGAVTTLTAAKLASRAATAAQAAGLVSFTTTAAAATTGARVLAGALALMGGPVGAVVTVLGLAATAWAVFSSSAEDANRKAAASAGESTADILNSFEKQIEKIEERNKKAREGMPAPKPANKGEEELKRIQGEINAIAAGAGKYANFNAAEKQAVLIALGAQYGKATELAERFNKATAEEGRATGRSNYKKWMDEYASQADKLEETLKKARAETGGAFNAKLEKAIRARFGDDGGAAAAAARAAQAAAADKARADAKLDAVRYEVETEKAKRADALAEKMELHRQGLASDEEVYKLRHEAALKAGEEAEKIRQTEIEQLKGFHGKTQAEEITRLARITQLEKEKIEVVRASKAQAELLRTQFEHDAKKKPKAEAQPAEDPEIKRTAAMVAAMTELDNASKSAAKSMETVFGRMGKAAGGVVTAITGAAKAQASIAAKLAADTRDANGDPVKLSKAQQEAAEQTAKTQIAAYGDMAGAAKGFFKENSAGYRAMEGAEKAFRAVEMAMAIESMVRKGGLLTAFTSLFVSSKATETAATVASIGPDVAASAVKGQAAAAAGVAAQAQGDPYSAWVRMAMMAATMAALGFAVSGGGGGNANIAKERQAKAGTGTVLGDANAKSESISHSLELLEQNSGVTLQYTRGMLQSLRNIEASISGLGNLVVRAAPIGKVAPDEMLGGLASRAAGFIAKGFGSSKSVIDNGIISGPQTLGSVLDSGLAASGYADVETKKKALWITYSRKVNTELSALPGEVTSQLSLVVRNLADGTRNAVALLGVSGDEFNRTMSSFVVDLGKISLKGLSGEDVQKQFEAIFSALGDKMARQAMPALAEFQQVGEGYFETLVRVANNYASVDAILHSMGTTFGAVGVSSIKARERLIELAGGIDKLSEGAGFFAENFLTEAERMAPVTQYVTEQMTALGYGSVKTKDQFKDAVLGLTNSGALATESGAALYTSLIELAPAFLQVAEYVETLTGKVADSGELAKQRIELEAQLYDLTHTDAEALARQRDAELAAMDESLHGLQKQIWAHEDLAEAAEQAADALRTSANDAMAVLNRSLDNQRTVARAAFDAQMASINAQKEATTAAFTDNKARLEKSINALSAANAELKNLSGSLKSTLESMAEGFNSQAQTRANAQGQIAAALAIARASGVLPKADDLKSALSIVARPSEGLFATFADYARDYARTAADIAALNQLTEGQLSEGERALEVQQGQLELLQKNYDLTILALEGQAKAAQEELDRNLAQFDFIQKMAEEQLRIAEGTNIGIRDLAAAITGFNGAVQALARSNSNTVTPVAVPAPAAPAWEIVKPPPPLVHPPTRSVAGFANGGDHLGGLRVVGESGRELEATGPARYWTAAQTKQILGGGGLDQDLLREVVTEIRGLRAEQRAGTAASVTATKATTKLLRDLSDNGTAILTKEAN